MPTIFPKPDGGNSQQTKPSQRPASERRKQKAVSTSYKKLMIKHSLLKAMFYIIQTVDEALQTSVESSASTTLCTTTSLHALMSTSLDEVPMETHDNKQDKG